MRVIGQDLPASSTLDLMWGTADCNWIIEGEAGQEYHGRECATKQVPLETLSTDPAGVLETSFVRNRALFNLDMEVNVTPQRGPVGTPITIEIKGMGYSTLENTRAVLYDNAYVGWMSAVTTKRSARAVIPAVGDPGKHVIQLARGAYTFPYLNPAQSPRPDIPVFEATFTVTNGPPVLPSPIAKQNPPAIPQSTVLDSDGPAIATDLASGPVGSKFKIDGTGFDPGARVALDWYRIVGNRVGGQGWDEQSLTMGEVVADDEGAFAFETEIPMDVGGSHRIEALVAGISIAETTLAVSPAASSLSSPSGPVNSRFMISLTGVE